MNKVFLIGNLTKDPELSETSNGTAVCVLNIAVNRKYQNSDGEKVVDFFKITAWRSLAENCGRYLKKGSKVSVVGELNNQTYEDKDGNKRRTAEVVTDNVYFGDSKNSNAPGGVEQVYESMKNGTFSTDSDYAMLEGDDDALLF